MSNLLNGTKCYTIGQLQHESFSYAKEWRSYLQEQLKELNITILSPLDKMFRNFPVESSETQKQLKNALKNKNYKFVHETMKSIRNRDLAACDYSTFLVAVLDPNKPTWGSIDELITAKRNQKPIFLVIPKLGYAGIPLWLSSYFKPNWVYKSIDDVIKTIYKIDSGKEKINNKYWKILV